MSATQTSPILVPPPPRPPATCIAASADDSPRHPLAGDTSAKGPSTIAPPHDFFLKVIVELKRMVWPTLRELWPLTIVTLGLIAVLTMLVCGSGIFVEATLRPLGLLMR